MLLKIDSVDDDTVIIYFASYNTGMLMHAMFQSTLPIFSSFLLLINVGIIFMNVCKLNYMFFTKNVLSRLIYKLPYNIFVSFLYRT